MSREKGNIAEERAIEFLEKKGFFIVDRNFYSKFGEIDIIAKKDGILHFIEVKSSFKTNSLHPIYNITPKKLSKIIKTIDYFLIKNRIDMPYSIDAIIVLEENIEFYQNITI